mmetsp:Transcript_41704/g.95710  ORF Transcript_41704/g.95710 Transcript_41704/m.95710 type:complete len:244 (+) Transcript_41704:81-812(+)
MEAAAHAKLAEGMVQNVLEMLAGSDDPMAMKARLLEILSGKGAWESRNMVVKMLRFGWQAQLEGMRTGVTNLGVTAALVLSVTLSLIIEPPQPTDDESAFEEVHKELSDVAYICFHLATLFALVAVIFSIIWVNYSISFLHDADDFLWFCGFFPANRVDIVIVLCLLSAFAGLIVSTAVVARDPAASMCVYSGTGVLVFTLLWYIHKLVCVRSHNEVALKRLNASCTKAINQAYAQFESSLGS